MARLSASSSAQTNGAPPQPHLPPASPPPPVSSPTQPPKRRSSSSLPIPFDPTLDPTGPRSLSHIAFQAFLLGLTLATSLLLTHNLSRTPWWRLPAFFACLSTFHYLEFHTTATYNPSAARASSFLLYSNGRAYNVAHCVATIEIVLSCFYPRQLLYHTSNRVTILLGLALVAVGQSVRSLAMAQAGSNFNHTLARTYCEGHVLVTQGVYGWLRHPAYFGFFYWALGTQMLVGNKLSLVGYAFVLWGFFRKRIEGEERTLVQFFGDEYVGYRQRVGTGLPGI